MKGTQKKKNGGYEEVSIKKRIGNEEKRRHVHERETERRETMFILNGVGKK